MQQRGAAAAAGKRAARPVAQVYAPPGGGGAPGGPAFPGQAVPLTAEELAARERNNVIMAGSMLALVGYGYYVTVIKKPSMSGGCCKELIAFSNVHLGTSCRAVLATA